MAEGWSAVLAEALELTALFALHAPDRYERAATRWLQRFLEGDERTLSEAALVVACLGSLGGPRHEAALTALSEATANREGTLS